MSICYDDALLRCIPISFSTNLFPRQGLEKWASYVKEQFEHLQSSNPWSTDRSDVCRTDLSLSAISLSDAGPYRLARGDVLRYWHDEDEVSAAVVRFTPFL